MINMRKILALAVMAIMAVAVMHAATVSNDYFTLSTPDDSWTVSTDPSMHAIGTRVMVQRGSSRGISELARIDVIAAPFSPAGYIESQAVGRRDPFCREAQQLSAVADTTFAGRPAKRVTFTKQSHGTTYQCAAIAFNAGFNTFYVVTGRRSNLPDVVGAVAGEMKFKCDTARLATVVQYVRAAKGVLAKHNMQIADNEYLDNVEMTDSQTLELEVMIPYLTRQTVNVTAFVQQMRERWFSTLPSAYRLNLIIAAAIDEGKRLRYVYTDNRGGEIGTMLIYPQEYAATIGEIRKSAENKQ